jgi:hypothetical protein
VKPLGKRPLGRPRRRQEDIININIGETVLLRGKVDRSTSGSCPITDCIYSGVELLASATRMLKTQRPRNLT